MTPRLALGLYLAALLAVGFVHDPLWLGAAMALALFAAGTGRWRLLWRSLRAVVAFNLCVSVGYALVAAWQGELSWLVLLRINLRVVLLVFLGFWFIDRVNLLEALRFSPTLSLLATLAAGHVVVFRRIARDFRAAIVSRSAGRRLPWQDRLRHGAALSTHLLDKSVASAELSARALRSRGCFDE